ncbi:hypothetical protein U1Q18_026510 [Sarracenia purpurea var. burkii]
MATTTTNKEENPRKILDQQEKQPISDPLNMKNDSLNCQQSPPPVTDTDLPHKDSGGSKGVGVYPKVGAPTDPTSLKNDPPGRGLQNIAKIHFSRSVNIALRKLIEGLRWSTRGDSRSNRPRGY